MRSRIPILAALQAEPVDPMPTYRFNMFGTIVDVTRKSNQWHAYSVGTEGKRTPAGFVIPEFVEAENLEQFLFDLFHERANGNGEIFRIR